MWCIDKKPPVFQDVCIVIVHPLFNFRAREGGRRGRRAHFLLLFKEVNTESKMGSSVFGERERG